MAILAATIANRGQVMAPHLVGNVFDADGAEVEITEPDPLIQAISADTASVMTLMMERVVTEGTGRLAAVPGVRVAGKTGTSTGTGGHPHAWFIGFAPVDQPTIAIAVFVEAGSEPASGGAVAAPIAARVLSDWLSR